MKCIDQIFLLFRNRKMLGEIFSVTNLVSVAFLAYMGNSVFTLGKFWFPETCPEDADFDGKSDYSTRQIFASLTKFY